MKILAHGSLTMPTAQVNAISFFINSILAKGASGGAGVENPGPSHGAVVEATFNLSRGDKLYILVGQEGEKACDSVSIVKMCF